jgi:hypothetical protein
MPLTQDKLVYITNVMKPEKIEIPHQDIIDAIEILKMDDVIVLAPIVRGELPQVKPKRPHDL